MASEFDDLRRDLVGLYSNSKALRIAGLSLIAEQTERIFDRGQDSSGGRIGTYSPAYKKLRQRMGLDANKVVLELTSAMRKDYSVLRVGETSIEIGFKQGFNADKAVWNEDRYGKDVFSTSEKEDNLFFRIFEKNLQI